MEMFFKKRKRLKRFASAQEIHVAFDQLRQKCPGAAYIFARTLYNGSDMIEDTETPASQKITHIDAQIVEAKATSGADSGVGILGMRFTRLLIKFMNEDVESSIWFSGVYVQISEQGKTYRGLRTTDSLVSKVKTSRKILEAGGHESVADLITAIRQEAAELILKKPERKAELVVEYKETVMTFLALFDMREEAEEQNLFPLINEIDVWLRQAET